MLSQFFAGAQNVSKLYKYVPPHHAKIVRALNFPHHHHVNIYTPQFPSARQPNMPSVRLQINALYAQFLGEYLYIHKRIYGAIILEHIHNYSIQIQHAAASNTLYTTCTNIYEINFITQTCWHSHGCIPACAFSRSFVGSFVCVVCVSASNYMHVLHNCHYNSRRPRAYEPESTHQNARPEGRHTHQPHT